MMFINELRVKGLRRLADATIPMGPLTVLIGANGSGKSSVLDTMSLISASAIGKLGNEVSRLGGLASILTVGRGSLRQMALSLQVSEESNSRFEYAFDLLEAGYGYVLGSELLRENVPNMSDQPLRLIGLHSAAGSEDESGKFEYLTVNAKPGETALSRIPNEKQHLSAIQLRNWLASTVHYRSPSVAAGSPIRLPQKLQPASSPETDAANLISLLYTLRESNPLRFETLEATLRAAYDRFVELKFPPVGGGMLGLTWSERGFERPFFATDLSDGQLRFLSLTACLLTHDSPGILLIDEPEDSLHPELLALLADLLREASARSQIVVATHSDRLIRFLKPEEVVAVDLDDDGMAHFTRASDLNLSQWLEDYSLDQLWLKGLLGGRL